MSVCLVSPEDSFFGLQKPSSHSFITFSLLSLQCIQISSSYKDSSQIGFRFIHMISFELDYIQTGHIMTYQRLRLQQNGYFFFPAWVFFFFPPPWLGVVGLGHRSQPITKCFCNYTFFFFLYLFPISLENKLFHKTIKFQRDQSQKDKLNRKMSSQLNNWRKRILF